MLVDGLYSHLVLGQAGCTCNQRVTRPDLCREPAGERREHGASEMLPRDLSTEVDPVGAIVTYDEPTEAVTRYAPYELKANGVVQPGG